MKFSQRAGRCCVAVLACALLTQARAGAAPSNAPFPAPVTFQSPPHGSGRACGTDETLTLRTNGTFVVRFLADRLELSEARGSWRYDAPNAKLIMSTGDHPPFFYHAVSATALEELDRAGKPVRGGCVRRLARIPRIIEFSGEMRPIDLWSDRWTLAGFATRKALLPVGARLPDLTFDAATKRISGWTGCSRIHASYEIAGARLTFSPLAATRITCAPPLAGIETRFLRALRLTTSYHVCCWTLELRAGTTLLATFVALR